MRLYEIVNPPFYLSTVLNWNAGDILSPTPVHPLGTEREGNLEFRRPDDALPRDRSFYLDSEPCNGPYVYLVVPIGQVDRQSTSWLKLLSETPLTNAGELDSYSGGYWSGKPWPEDQNAPIQTRALRVKIVKRVGGNELQNLNRDRRASTGGATIAAQAW